MEKEPCKHCGACQKCEPCDHCGNCRVCGKPVWPFRYNAPVIYVQPYYVPWQPTYIGPTYPTTVPNVWSYAAGGSITYTSVGSLSS